MALSATSRSSPTPRFCGSSANWSVSPAHREVIDLVYYHEKSVDEVSRIVGVPAATVKTRMFYARNKMAELLKQSGVSAL